MPELALKGDVRVTDALSKGEAESNSRPTMVPLVPIYWMYVPRGTKQGRAAAVHSFACSWVALAGRIAGRSTLRGTCSRPLQPSDAAH